MWERRRLGAFTCCLCSPLCLLHPLCPGLTPRGSGYLAEMSPLVPPTAFLPSEDNYTEALSVIQDPPQSQTLPGGSVTMRCHVFTRDQEWSRLRLEWKRRDLPTTLCTALILLLSNLNHSCIPRFNLTWQWPMVTLHLDNATEQDVGVYECSVNVEIPNLLSAVGNGTALNVSGEGPWGLGARGGSSD